MFVSRKERCLRLSTTACEERTGGKGCCSYEPEALLAHGEDNRPGQEREDIISPLQPFAKSFSEASIIGAFGP